MAHISFFALISLLLTISQVSDAWSLPPCDSGRENAWHNCQGTWTSPNHAEYSGEWKDDKRHGQGTITWPDGQKYVGTWKNDRRHGHGTHARPDGLKYVGEFKD
ncbi:uncharacterized protein METZ01_LOCUS459920, partial [marine metagenome]